MNENKTISISVSEAKKQNERAHAYEYKCSLTNECPLYKQKTCLLKRFSLCRVSCPYGKIVRHDSQTKRSKSYNSFLKEWKEKTEGYEKIDSPKSEMLLKIGDYAYLPYTHMNHHDGEYLKIPFSAYSSFLSSGTEFMKWEDFTPETIIKLVKLKPHALMGGEITDYQKKHLPNFLFHLKNMFKDIYDKVLSIDPSISRYLENMKFPKDLKCPIRYIPDNVISGYFVEKDYDVTVWDGSQLILTSKKNEIPFHWNMKGVNSTQITLSFYPDKEKTMVIITDPELTKTICLKNPELLK